MSTFDGVLKEYPLISIDNFTEECENYSSTVYFLSHCHKDHMRGLGDHKFYELLTSRGFSKIYMSSVSENLLKNDPEYFHLSSFLVSIPMEEPMLIGIPDIQGNICSQVVVTLLTAGHCPGSVMFLFEGSNGRVLYTGDFRLPIGSSARLMDLHDECGRLKKLDSLYVDTTFCKEECLYIPSREECLNSIISLVEPWLAKGPEYVVHFFCPAQYAYEFVFVELFKKFKVKTHVNEEKEKKYQGIKIIEDAVTSLSTDARIHACMYDMDMLPFNEYEIETPCGYHTLDYKPIQIMKIRPSAMFFKNNEFKDISAFQKKKQFYRVCYSTHSSLSEIRDLVHYLKPKAVYPNVVQKQTVEEILDLLHFSSENSMNDFKNEKASTPPLGMLKTIYVEDNILTPSDSMPFFDECYELSLNQPTAISSLLVNLHEHIEKDAEQEIKPSKDNGVCSLIKSPIKWDFTLSSEDELSSSPVKLNYAVAPSKVLRCDSTFKTCNKNKTVSHQNSLILQNQDVSVLEDSLSDSFELRASVKLGEEINIKANNCLSNNASNEKEVIDSSDKIQNKCFAKNMTTCCENSKRSICERKENSKSAMFDFLNDNLSHLFSSEENEILPVSQIGNDVKGFKNEIVNRRTEAEENSTSTKKSYFKCDLSKKFNNLDDIDYKFFQFTSLATDSEPVTNKKHNLDKDNIKYNFFKQTSSDLNLEGFHHKERTYNVPVQTVVSCNIKKITNANEHDLKEILSNKSKGELLSPKSCGKDVNFYNTSTKKSLFKDRYKVNKTVKINYNKYDINGSLCARNSFSKTNSTEAEKNCVSSEMSTLNQLVSHINDKKESCSNSVASLRENITYDEKHVKDEQKTQVSSRNGCHQDNELKFIEKCTGNSEIVILDKGHDYPVLSKNNIDYENAKDCIQNIDESSNDSICVMSNDNGQSEKRVELIELSSDESDDEKYYVVKSCLSGKAKDNGNKNKANNLECNKNSRQFSQISKVIDAPSDSDDSPSLIEPKKAKLSVESIVSSYSAAFPKVTDNSVPAENAVNYVALTKCSSNPEDLPSFESTPDDLSSAKDILKNSFKHVVLKNHCDEFVIDDDS